MKILSIIVTVLLLSGCIKSPDNNSSEQAAVTTEELLNILDTDIEIWMNAFLNNEKIGYTYSTVNNTSYFNEEILNLKSYSYLKIQRYENEIVTENTPNQYMELLNKSMVLREIR